MTDTRIVSCVTLTAMSSLDVRPKASATPDSIHDSDSEPEDGDRVGGDTATSRGPRIRPLWNNAITIGGLFMAIVAVLEKLRRSGADHNIEASRAIL